MAGKGLSAILAMLVVSISLSGCIGQFGGESSLNDSEDGDSSSELEYTKDGIFTCIEHGNLTRCWQTHVLRIYRRKLSSSISCRYAWVQFSFH